jgi:hypothetical protein
LLLTRNDATFLIDLAFAQPEMHVASPLGPLDASAALPTWPVESQVTFKPLPSSYVAPEGSIFDATYRAGDYVPVSRVREAYAGGPTAFDAEIKRLITVEPGTAYGAPTAVPHASALRLPTCSVADSLPSARRQTSSRRRTSSGASLTRPS